MPQLVLTNSIRMVDLVSQNQKRRLGQFLHTQQRIELDFAFGETFGVFCVDEEDYAADFGEVVLPQTARLLVSAEIEGREAHGADAEFFAGRVESWLEDCYAVVLEHVEELFWILLVSGGGLHRMRGR